MELKDFKKELVARHAELSKVLSSACRGLAFVILGSFLSSYDQSGQYLRIGIVCSLLFFGILDIFQYLIQLGRTSKYIKKLQEMDESKFEDNNIYACAYCDFLVDNKKTTFLFYVKIACLSVSLVLVLIQFIKIC